VTSSCSKGKLLGNQNDGTKKINPYSGTDTETNPSDISGAWLVMCRSEPTSDGAFLLQCRANDRNGIKYIKDIDFKIKLPDGSQLDPSQIKKNSTQDYFTFEATIRSPGPVRLEAKSSDGIISISKNVSLGSVQDLPGLLVGVCGFTNPPLNNTPFPAEPPATGCTIFKSDFFTTSNSRCPNLYTWAPTSSRFQAAVGSGMLQWGSGTCFLSKAAIDSQLLQEMERNPADFVVKEAAYGHSFNYTGNCDPGANAFPMRLDCSCPEGFLKTEISSHVGGYTTGRSYTCMALATGSRAAALQKDAMTNLKNYINEPEHPNDMLRCVNSNWAPVAANGGGLDTNWRSVCLAR
jgi:hypothetical protein